MWPFANLPHMTGVRASERGGVVASLGVVIGALALGGAGGFLAARLSEPTPLTIDTTPMAAASPSVPFTPYSADVAYPAWQPDLTYRHAVIGTGPFAWRYDVPRGWTASVSDQEVRWGLPDRKLGSYSFRIAQVGSQHSTVEALVANKLRELREAESDVRVLQQTADTLAITYRAEPQNWLRYNTFRWFAYPGGTSAAIEISVNGRGIDQPGMTDLLQHVSGTLAPR